LIINTPTEGKVSYTDGFYIRRYAVDLGMPYITTITGAEAAAEAIESMKKGEISIRSIGEYHKWHVHELRLEDFG
jgi:carbamoyl-phosphate synthase large subunit